MKQPLIGLARLSQLITLGLIIAISVVHWLRPDQHGRIVNLTMIVVFSVLLSGLRRLYPEEKFGTQAALATVLIFPFSHLLHILFDDSFAEPSLLAIIIEGVAITTALHYTFATLREAARKMPDTRRVGADVMLAYTGVAIPALVLSQPALSAILENQPVMGTLLILYILMSLGMVVLSLSSAVLKYESWHTYIAQNLVSVFLSLYFIFELIAIHPAALPYLPLLERLTLAASSICGCGGFMLGAYYAGGIKKAKGPRQQALSPLLYAACTLLSIGPLAIIVIALTTNWTVNAEAIAIGASASASVLAWRIISILEKSQSASERFRLESRQDALTLLSNRRGFIDYLNENRAQNLKVAYLDIDKFKEINDSYGHKVGDEVLQLVANHLRDLGPGVKTARLGGDEFVVAIDKRVSNADAIVQSISDNLNKKHDLSGLHLQLSVSIGLSQDEPVHHARELLQSADQQMYQIKKDRHAAQTTLGPETASHLQELLELNNMPLARKVLRHRLQIHAPINDLTLSRRRLNQLHINRSELMRMINSVDRQEAWFSSLLNTINHSRSLRKAALIALPLEPAWLNDRQRRDALIKQFIGRGLEPKRFIFKLCMNKPFDDEADHLGMRENIDKLTKLGFHVAIQLDNLDHNSLTEFERLGADYLFVEASPMIDYMEQSTDIATLLRMRLRRLHNQGNCICLFINDDSQLNIGEQIGADYLYVRPLNLLQQAGEIDSDYIPRTIDHTD